MRQGTMLHNAPVALGLTAAALVGQPGLVVYAGLTLVEIRCVGHILQIAGRKMSHNFRCQTVKKIQDHQ